MDLCEELLLEEAEGLRISYDDFEEAIPGPSTAKSVFQWPSNRPHPLLIPDIARNIFESLDMIDVEMCRKVCRGWNEESCKVLQEKKIVALLEIDAVKFYVEKMEHTPYFPHSQFELHMEYASEKLVLMKTFWTTFGSHIKSLELRESVVYVETLFQLLNERLPFLERLTLKTLPRRAPARRNSHPPPHQHEQVEEGQILSHQFQFLCLKELNLCWCPQDDYSTKSILKDLLRAMPNLEILSLKDIPTGFVMRDGIGSRTHVSGLVLQLLTDVDVNLPHLKKIDFPLDLGNTELEALTRKTFQFRNLNLKLKLGVKSSTLKDLLVKLSPYLRSLEIVFPENFFTCGVSFPAYFLMKPAEAAFHLKQVKELTLTNFQGTISFIRNLDKLETLIVNNANITPGIPSQPSVFQSLDARADVTKRIGFEHKLTTFSTDSSMDACVVSSLSKCFPLLRVLHINGLDDDGLGVIYRNLPYIRELEITGGMCTDQGLSGVPLEVCEDMAETSSFKCVDPNKFRTDLFLGSLQYLSTFTVCSESVSDVSIAFGIVECKNLENLTLKSPVVTDTGMIEIANKMGKTLKVLNVLNCENVSEAGKYYVKAKLSGVQLMLEPSYSTQRILRPENPYRQVGFAFRPPYNRQLEENSFMAAMGGDYDRLPGRDRMFALMERRRRHLQIRALPHLRGGRGMFNQMVFGLNHPPVMDNAFGVNNPPQPPVPQYPQALNLVQVEMQDMSDDESDDDMEADELPFQDPPPQPIPQVQPDPNFNLHLHQMNHLMMMGAHGEGQNHLLLVGGELHQLNPPADPLLEEQDPAPGAI